MNTLRAEVACRPQVQKVKKEVKINTENLRVAALCWPMGYTVINYFNSQHAKSAIPTTPML